MSRIIIDAQTLRDTKKRANVTLCGLGAHKIKFSHIGEAVASGLGFRHGSVADAALKQGLATTTVAPEAFAERLVALSGKQSVSDAETSGAFLLALGEALETLETRSLDYGVALGRVGDRGKSGHIYADLGPLVLTVAPAGSGPGVHVSVPNALRFSGGLFVIDSKGEHQAITSDGRRDRLGHEIFTIAPDDGETTDWLDPIDIIPIDDASLACRFAKQLAVRSFGSFRSRSPSAYIVERILSPITVEATHRLLAILFVAAAAGEISTGTSILDVRNALTHRAALPSLLDRLSQTRLGPALVEADLLVAPDDLKIAASAASTALEWLAFGNAARCVSVTGGGKKVDVRAFADGKASVYLRLRPNVTNTVVHAGLIELVTAALATAKEFASTKAQALFVMNEAQFLRGVPYLHGLDAMAANGARFLLVYRNVEDLDRTMEGFMVDGQVGGVKPTYAFLGAADRGDNAANIYVAHRFIGELNAQNRGYVATLDQDILAEALVANTGVVVVTEVNNLSGGNRSIRSLHKARYWDSPEYVACNPAANPYFPDEKRDPVREAVRRMRKPEGFSIKRAFNRLTYRMFG